VAEKAFNPSRGALHRSLIASVLNYHPEAKTHGFRKALEGCGSYMRELFRYEPEWWSGIALVPDAYMIDHERGAVIVFEAVHTHDITENKLNCYEEIGWALDQDCFEIVIVRVDRYGRRLIAPLEEALVRELIALTPEPRP
jgi:hypothetical protein